VLSVPALGSINHFSFCALWSKEIQLAVLMVHHGKKKKEKKSSRAYSVCIDATLNYHIGFSI